MIHRGPGWDCGLSLLVKALDPHPGAGKACCAAVGCPQGPSTDPDLSEGGRQKAIG